MYSCRSKFDSDERVKSSDGGMKIVKRRVIIREYTKIVVGYTKSDT